MRRYDMRRYDMRRYDMRRTASSVFLFFGIKIDEVI